MVAFAISVFADFPGEYFTANFSLVLLQEFFSKLVGVAIVLAGKI